MRKKRVEILGMILLISCCTPVYANEEQTEFESVTETESGSEEEKAYTADPQTADRLLVKPRTFTMSEILNAYLGDSQWDEELITEQKTESSKREIFENDQMRITFSDQGGGFCSIMFEYLDEIPDEAVLHKGWEQMFRRLELPIMEEYDKQTDADNDNRISYIYYLEQDGIKICPTDYIIGGNGNETLYFGQNIAVYMEEKGFTVALKMVSDVVEREEVSDKRMILSEEEAVSLLYDSILATYQISVLEENPVEDSTIVEIQYMMVDLGTEKDEYVFDIGVYVKQTIQPEGTQGGILWCVEGFIDGTLPYCYKVNMGMDMNAYYHTVQLKYSPE